MGTKQYNFEVTVLTPTFNRGRLLKQLFSSLQRQKNQNFQWLIIDDGSKDDTKEIVSSFQNHQFPVEYHYKNNGGKHTALNFSHPYIQGELVVIVDSDDFLTDDAIETIIQDWEKYRNNPHIAGISYLRITPKGFILSSLPEKDYFESNFIQYRVNRNITGDQCEVTRTDIFVNFPFPVFSGERFMSEGILWRAIGRKYNTIYRSKSIYVCEYLDGGLTKSGRSFRMKNPYGMMENCNSFFLPKINWKIKVKEAILFDVYAFCTQEGILRHLRNSKAKILCTLMVPIGYLFYLKWNQK